MTHNLIRILNKNLRVSLKKKKKLRGSLIFWLFMVPYKLVRIIPELSFFVFFFIIDN